MTIFNKEKNSFSVIAIVGLGLIGGSLASLIKETYANIFIIGIDPNSETINFARKQKIIDKGYVQLADVTETPDLVFVATPIQYVGSTIDAISQKFEHELIITDVASVKNNLMVLPKNLKPQHGFVPGHPMAGIEKTGIEYAHQKILKGATYILGNAINTTDVILDEFLKSLGFNTLVLNNQEHDELVAMASHLPYVMAVLTAQTPFLNTRRLKNFDKFKQIVSTGFKDTSRVASSSPSWGKDVCLSNKSSIVVGLRSLQSSIEQLIIWIESDDATNLENYFNKIKLFRDSIYS